MSDEHTSDQALAADDLRSRAEELEASRGNRVDLADPAPAGFVEADAAEAARWRQNLDAFFNTIDDLLFVLDAAGTMIHVNETACRRLGYPAEELIGRPVLDVHPPDRRGEAGRMVAAMLAGSADVCTVPVVTKDGVEIPVETRVVPGVWDGGPAFFGVTKEFQEVREALDGE